MLKAVDNGGTGLDSHGVRAYGQRGLYETFERLGVPVQRITANPEPFLQDKGTIAYLGPLNPLLENEPGYLERVAAWVKEGGRVLISPRRLSWMEENGSTKPRGSKKRKRFNLWTTLGLPDLVLKSITLGPPSKTYPDFPTIDPLIEDLDYREDPLPDRLQGTFKQRIPETTRVLLEGSGDLIAAAKAAPKLRIPQESLRTFLHGADEATGTLFFRASASMNHAKPEGETETTTKEEEHESSAEEEKPKLIGKVNESKGEEEEVRELVVAARFPVGKGEVIVVSEPRLVQNWFLSNDDNAVLFYSLMVKPGEPVVFDEFYHGLTIRGNPLWLAAKFPYSLLIVAVLLATGLWIWRDVRALGPPVPLVESSRRSLSEYIDAMARFLLRGRKVNHFILEEIRDGVLWKLRGELGMSAAGGSVESITAGLAKKDPVRASKFNESIQTLEAMIAARKRPTNEETVTAIQRITECL
ncbi:MAG: DUF4350 domain-containing protein [Planctomycetota bacterium]